MIELELTSDKQYLLWMMDDWTNEELNRAINRHRERRGFAPVNLVYNNADKDKVEKFKTGLLLREDSKVPAGYINLS